MTRSGRLVAVTIGMGLGGLVLAGDGLSDEVRLLLDKAKTGDAQAQFRVATAYDWGRGAPRNGDEAKRWYLASAERGYAEAQNSIGSSLQAENKMSEALAWYQKSAAQDNEVAINNLGYFYDLGLGGLSQDRKKAFELYKKSADLGWYEAMWNLATMYGAGQVGEPDFVMGCAWTLRAQRFAMASDAKFQRMAKGRIAFSESKLSREQMQTCRVEGSAWSPTRVRDNTKAVE